MPPFVSRKRLPKVAIMEVVREMNSDTNHVEGQRHSLTLKIKWWGAQKVGTLEWYAARIRTRVATTFAASYDKRLRR